MQSLADIYLAALKETFTQLKNDANFIIECNAGTLELIKDAQEAAAQAAQQSAFAQQVAMMSSSNAVMCNAPANASISAQISL